MQIKDSRFHKVWEVKNQNGFTKVNLGDSKKNKDGGYDNFTWFDCLLVGNAKNVQLNKGDTITVVSGQITKRKYNGKFYDDMVIFELEVTKRAEVNPVQSDSGLGDFQALEDDDSIPF